jgi:hypothetical protein
MAKKKNLLYLPPHEYPIPCESSHFFLRNHMRHFLVCFSLSTPWKQDAPKYGGVRFSTIFYKASTQSYMCTYTESNQSVHESKHSKLQKKKQPELKRYMRAHRRYILFSSHQQSAMLFTTAPILSILYIT